MWQTRTPNKIVACGYVVDATKAEGRQLVDTLLPTPAPTTAVPTTDAKNETLAPTTAGTTKEEWQDMVMGLTALAALVVGVLCWLDYCRKSSRSGHPTRKVASAG